MAGGPRPAGVTITFEQPVRARFVKVGLEGKEFLHLRKVWVFGGEKRAEVRREKAEVRSER